MQLNDQNTLLKAQLAAGATSNEHTQVIDDSILRKLEKLEAENNEKDEELDNLRKDQEDLLLLLTDQDRKLNTFKNRLRELGENIDDGDSDENNSGDSDNES